MRKCLCVFLLFYSVFFSTAAQKLFFIELPQLEMLKELQQKRQEELTASQERLKQVQENLTKCQEDLKKSSEQIEILQQSLKQSKCRNWIDRAVTITVSALSGLTVGYMIGRR